MGTPNYGPIQPFMDRVGKLRDKASEALNYPGEALKRMLGIEPAPVQHGADPGMVREANESFRQNMTQPPSPVVAPPRRKSMSGGEL